MTSVGAAAGSGMRHLQKFRRPLQGTQPVKDVIRRARTLLIRAPPFPPLNLRLVEWSAEIAHSNEPRIRVSFVLGVTHNIARVLQAHFDVSVEQRSISLCQVEDA